MLQDAQIQSTCAALAQVAKLLPDDKAALIEKLRARQDVASLADDLDGGSLDNGLSVQAVNAVLLLRKILDVDGVELSFALNVLLHTPEPTLQAVAKTHYNPRQSLDHQTSDATLSKWQSFLYAVEPTAVISNLVRSGILQPGEDVFASVNSLLEGALKSGYNVLKDSTRDFLNVASLSRTEHEKALLFVRAMRRLQALVTTPKELVSLYESGLHSASAIAAMTVDSFVHKISSSGLEASRARQVHSNAWAIAVRNRQSWALLLSSRTDQLLPALRKEVVRPKQVPPSTAEKSDIETESTTGLVDYVTMFKEKYSFDCTSCQSVLSPAAYLADLLHVLNLQQVDGLKTLLGKLLERRPDLLDVELSCYNTNTLIPYVDIAIEVMESYLWNSYSASLPAVTCSEAGADNTNTLGIQSRNFSMYQDLFGEISFPMDVFPCNLSLQTLRLLLKAHGTTLKDVQHIFSSGYRLLTEYLPPAVGNSYSETLLQQAELVLKTVQACEVLGMQEDDLICFAHEKFVSLDIARQLASFTAAWDVDTYNAKLVGHAGCAKYWGYQDEKQMLNMSDKSLSSLKEVLERASISYSELVEVLKTNFIGRRLIITAKDGCQGIKQDIDDMRLRSSVLVNDSGKLTQEVCDDLQIFIRLRRKLNLSAANLDIVLTSLSNFKPAKTSGLSRRLIIELSAVVELRSLVPSVGLEDLCCLWSTICSRGPGDSIHEDLLAIPQSTKPGLLSGPTYTFASMAQVAALLGIDYADYETLTQQLGLKSVLQLSLDQLSQLHSCSVFCRLIGAGTADLTSILSSLNLDLGTKGLFEGPMVVLDIFREWTKIRRVFKNTTSTLNALAAVVDPPATSLKMDELGDKALDIVRQAHTSALGLSVANILRILGEMYNKIDPRTIVSAAKGTTLEATLKDCASLLTMTSSDEVDSWDGFFSPLAAGLHHFQFETDVLLPTLHISGTAVELSKLGGNRYSASVMVGNLSWLPIRLNVVPKIALWSVDSSKTTTMPSALFCHKRLYDDLLALVTVFEGATALFTELPLTEDELRATGHSLYLTSASRRESAADRLISLFDQKAFNFSRLRALVQYVEMRASIPEASRGRILDFLKGGKPSDVSVADFLSQIMGWRAVQIQELLDHHYPGKKEEDIYRVLQNPAIILKFSMALEYCHKIKIPGVDMNTFHLLAQPLTAGAVSSSAAKIVDAVLSLNRRGSTTAAEPLKATAAAVREDRRKVLLAYITKHAKLVPYKEIRDADSLFEFFLIDVNTGPATETSRIAQAISTIQLYVQRCFLGLEESFGVLTGDIQDLKKDWRYYGKYTTWEANRKVFLFPENWILPSLRDNKTEQFKAFESAILKNDLTEANVNSAIKNYVYSVNAVANLEVQAYLWDKGKNGSGTFYFFARTRSEPYLLFSRSLEIKVFAGERLCYWKPWEGIDFDMTSQLVENNGDKVSNPGCYLIPALVNGRLFLFAPEIVLKSKPPAYTSGKSLYDFAQDKTAMDKSTMNAKSTLTKYWEIKMAWIEQRDGKWSTRSVSGDSVTVDAKDGKDLPMLGSFRFRLRARNRDETLKRKALKIASNSDTAATPHSGAGSSAIFNIGVDGFLILDIECWRKSSGAYVSEHLGQFEMRDAQLCSSTFTPPAFEGISVPKTLPTHFSKLIWDKESKKEADNSTKALPPYEIVEHTARWDERGEEQLLPIQPLLVDVDGGGASASQDEVMKWTLSFDSTQYSRPLGLVVDVTRPSAGPKTYFARPPTRELGLQVKSEILSGTVDIFPMHHGFSNNLVSAASLQNGIDQIFRVIKDNAEDAYAFGLYGANIFNECFDANSIYNWELGVHAILYVVEQLQSTQQFDLGLQYARLVFDPTLDGSDMSKCWLFPPFARGSFTASQSTTDLLASLKSSASGRLTFTDLAVAEWRGNPFNAHSIARSRPIAYMKRIVIKYIELLVAAGDVFFRQNSRESLPLALQKYIEAAHVFGPAPQRIDGLAKRPGRSFKQLSKDLDSFSNTAVDMELEFPYSSLQRGQGLSDEVNETPSAHGLPGLLSTTYFCVPQNPDLVKLRALIDDRLAKIRNNQDINGQASAMPLFDPPIDPGAMVQAYGAAAAGGGQVSMALKEITQSLGEYRFSVLLQKAYEINGELRSMSELFLAAKEKGDAEELSNLKAQQERAIATLTLATRNLQKEEASKTLEVLKDSQKSAESRLKFYLALVGESTKALPKSGSEWSEIQQNVPEPTKDDLKMSPEEKMEFEKAEEAENLGWKATILETTASALMAIPNITTNTQPMGLGLSMKIDAENVAKSLMGASTVLKLKSQLAAEEGGRASRKSQLKKQLQDRRLQANIAGRELVNLDRQIAAQQTRISTCDSDIKTQEAALQHASSTETWLKSKYTNKELYVWLESSTRMLNFELYSLAIDLARKAERALNFEQGNFSSSHIIDPRGYWNSTQNGLMTAQSLQLALKKLELSNMEQNPTELEISKTISLRQLSPAALIRLRAEGWAQFSLPEVIFDWDYPGHYFRRIRSVSLSVPCITGPYTSINATLSLLEHKCRVNPLASKSQYSDTGRDDRFQTQKVSTTSVAISERSLDAGVFELNFNSNCYMPFEKAGAISTWKLELPPLDLAQFDYSTISDVILHIKYTARQGGQGLRDAAVDATRAYRQSAAGLRDNEGLFALIDLPNECSDEWRAAVRNPANTDSTEVLLRDAREFLPFWAQGRPVSFDTALLALRTGDEELVSGEPQPPKHPKMKVETRSTGNKTWKSLASSTMLGAAVDKKESDKWAFFKSTEMSGVTPEQLRLKFTSTATPTARVDLQAYHQAYLLLRYTVS